MIATLAGYVDVVEYLVVHKKADFRKPNLVLMGSLFMHCKDV